MQTNIINSNGRNIMKSLSTLAVLAISISLLLACQLEAKKPNPKSDPHTVQLVVGDVETNCPIATSKGVTIKPLLSGFSLVAGDFDDLILNPAEPLVTLVTCSVTVHNKRGVVAGVTCFFGVRIDGEPAGLHRTDFLPAYATVSDGVWTIHVNADCVDVWKEKGPGKGTVAGQVSLGDIVYTPVP